MDKQAYWDHRRALEKARSDIDKRDGKGLPTAAAVEASNVLADERARHRPIIGSHYPPTVWRDINDAKRVQLGGGRGRAGRNIRRRIEMDQRRLGQ